MSEDLGIFALQKLRESGIEVMLNTRLTSASSDSVQLNNDNTVISTYTLIWAGGVIPDPLISNLLCDHDKNGRIIVDNYLQVQRYPDVFALGDCASITDRHTGKQCPPTAQHAIREGKVAAKNLISRITTEKKRQEQRGRRESKVGLPEEEDKNKNLLSFDYKTKV